MSTTSGSDPGKGMEPFFRCWGNEFCSLKGVLKFRFETGNFEGKSLFQSTIPDYLMETVWNEVEKNIGDACNVVHVDRNFSLILRLEINLNGLLIGKALYSVLRNNKDGSKY